MKRDIFRVSKMDCASEEQLVRMKLEPQTIVKNLRFDLTQRSVEIIHTGETIELEKLLASLNLGSEFLSTEQLDPTETFKKDSSEKKMLWYVLAINFSMFLLEIITGFISNSMGLVADSLDMLADALVYGLALFAVGGTIVRKRRIARTSGIFQFLLAIFGLVEVIRRFLSQEEIPGFLFMILISLFALVGNAASLYLLKRSQSNDSHMQASVIFTSNDVLANVGVIIAGIAVYFTGSKYPDLIVGSLIFLIVARGSVRILKL